jgi:hypothetical protein
MGATFGGWAEARDGQTWLGTPAGPDHFRVLPVSETRPSNGESPFCAHSEHD